MISDITRMGVTEPYRIFTSRSIDRLNLREENSNKRLLFISKNLKIINNNIKYKKIKNFIIKKVDFELNIKILKKIKNQLYIYVKYKNYINLDNIRIKKKVFLKNLEIPLKLNYFKIKGLPKEMCEKLNKYRPKNLKDIIFKKIDKNFLNIISKYLKN